MATLTVVKARQPYEFTQRYADSYWIVWMNELLEALAGEGFLMPSIDHETGVVVEDDVWIDKPDGMRTIGKIYNPAEPLMHYQYKEVENKIKLLNVEIDENDDPDTADAFQNYALGSIDVDIAAADEDDFKDYLLVIDGGTETGKTIIIKSNDAAALGYTKLYFRHDLSTVLDAAKITSCYLVSETYYVIIEHSGSYDDITAIGDEVPIDDKYEKRITKAWLRFKVEEATLSTSKETIYYSKQFDRVLFDLKAERRGLPGRPQPRYSPGFDQYRLGESGYDKDFESSDD
ncbi:MAG TPA: hypothetical protein VMV77_16785 [Bacteroidales bacterium]|nr:hypothetical protein [Bacteroidales bacterium]